MNPKNEEKFDFQVNEQFSRDLQSLFEPVQKLRPETERAIMDLAAARLHRRTNSHRILYWSGSVVAAAILVVFGAFVWNITQSSDISAPIALQNDINRDGAVDILDAFKLAREIESTDQADPKWDINSDGLIDQKDVDRLAMAAVRLNEGVL